MVNYEGHPASRHSRKPSYTEKPITFQSQPRDRSGYIFGIGGKDSSPETYENQRAELGVPLTNNNAVQVNRMNSNTVKFSDACNQVVEENIPHSPVDSDASKRNICVETPSRIPTPTSRRTKNLSKSSPEEIIRPKRQMNRRSQDFRFSATDDNDNFMRHADGSPSPATKTESQRTKILRRTHSNSAGAHHADRNVQENFKNQSSKSDQMKKEMILSNTKALFVEKNTIRKNLETQNKATNKTTKRNTPQLTDQKKSSRSNLEAYSRAQNKIRKFEKIFSKELPHISKDMASEKEPDFQELNPWPFSHSDDNTPKSVIPASMKEELYENQNNKNENWEDSIEITTSNLMSSPKLQTYRKKVETDSNSEINSASSIQSEYSNNSSSEEKIANREYSSIWISKSPPTSPSKKLSLRPDSERRDLFKRRGRAKLGDMTNCTVNKELQSKSNGHDTSEISQNTPKESLNEETNKDVGCKPRMLILDSENSSETKKKMLSASFAETQTSAEELQKISEKLNLNSKTGKDQKSTTFIYPLDPSRINSEKKFELKDSEKIPFEQKLDVDPEERIAAEARLFKPQVLDTNRFEVKSISAMSSTQLIPTKKGKCDETPRLDSKILPMETPKIVGAYIETPSSFSNQVKYIAKGFRRRAFSLESHDCKHGINLDTKRTRLQNHSPSQQIHLHRGSIRSSAVPININTAHRITASEDLRLIKKEENIQDSDLDSLIDEFAIVNENIDIDELIVKLQNDRFLDPELDHGRSNLSQVKSGRFFMDLTIDRMRQKLDNASHSFHDLKHGLERLEQQVASTSPFGKTTTTANSIEVNSDANAIPFLSLISTWLYIRAPSSRPEEPTRLFRDRNWKFTWLGLALSIFLLWYVAELAMCRVFCHPRYSNKNTWQPSDPFFPWAIPTKLDQWTGRFISVGIETVLNWFHHSTRTHQWPTHLYSGYDWWEGRSGPAVSNYITSTSSNFGAAHAGFGVGNINDDEILK